MRCQKTLLKKPAAVAPRDSQRRRTVPLPPPEPRKRLKRRIVPLIFSTAPPDTPLRPRTAGQTQRLSPRRRKAPLAQAPPDSQKGRKVPLSQTVTAVGSDSSHARSKVRVSSFGARVWVHACDTTIFHGAAAELRKTKPVWKDPKKWDSAVHKLARDRFKLASHGGKRDSHASRAVAAELSRESSSQALMPSSANGIIDLDESCDGPTAAATGRDCRKRPCGNALPLPDCAQPAAGAAQRCSMPETKIDCISLSLEHGQSTFYANYVADGAAVFMKAHPSPHPHVPFTPQPVVNWLYQVLGISLSVIQRLLGTTATFQDTGYFVDGSGNTASGGMLTTFWGTEMGARREQALIAWDYDVDLAAFITPGFDFEKVWLEASDILEPLGLRMVCHSPGFKYRICPIRALAYNEWKERYQQARLDNPGVDRGGLAHIAKENKTRGEPLRSPSGANCLDLEVYTVKPQQCSINIRGTKKIVVKCAQMFPIVEGVFGPLRVPLPASPHILDCEYGREWTHTRSAKVICADGKGVYADVTSETTRRCAWPTQPLRNCSELLGGFHGAGVYQSVDDVPWRFAPNSKDDSVSVDSNIA